MKTKLLLVLMLTLFGQGMALAADTSHTLQAGAGKAVIELPPELFPIEQFTTQHDPLYAKAMLLDNGAARIALLVIDMTSLSSEVVELVREIVSNTAAVAPADILVSASHTFSAPHVPPARPSADLRKRELLIAALSAAVRKATDDALRNLQAARVGFGTGHSHVNINRDLETRDGWYLGANEQGSSDKSVGVIRIDNEQGEPIAVLMNYAVQASIMNESLGPDGGRVVTADLAGAATRHVERLYGKDVVAMFLVGAAGDQAPAYVANRYTLDRNLNAGRADIGHAGLVLVDLLGERLGAEVVRVSESIRAAPVTARLRVVQGSMTFPELESSPNPASRRATRQHAFIEKGPAPMPYWIVQIGDIACVGVQVELSASTGMDIKAQSPFKNTLVLNMVNGAAKYLPDAGSFDNITYEALGARYARGSAEAFAAQAVQHLRRLQAEMAANQDFKKQ